MTHATARAYPNIALVKYWGKVDEALIIPAAGSMSMTLDDYATTTTVRLLTGEDGEDGDRFSLNGEYQQGSTADRVTEFLNIVRGLAAERGLGTADVSADVTSVNEGPTAAGMASSASGFAALAVAAASAYGLDLDNRGLSRLARRGSGSASRSVVNRYAVWHAGTSDETSFSEEIAAPDMAMIAITVASGAKDVSSRAGMRATAETSPFYPAWITVTEESLNEMARACADADFTRIGQIAESHAMRMHAVINSCDPPIRYLAPVSYAIFDRVAALRAEGLEAYATADAGPNVVVISRPGDAEAVAGQLSEFSEDGTAKILHPGPGAHLLSATEEAAEESEEASA